MSAYDGQILTGFVYVDATTDYRAVVIVQVVKNGAGTYEVAAADISGDDIGGSPIVTFSMSGTNLVATLPNFTGFASAYIQYKLDAPALGAQFPLQVDGSNVTLATASVQGAYKAGQAPGLTTGAAISAGYVGEIKEVTYDFNTATNGSWSTTSVLALTAGVWRIENSSRTTGAASLSAVAIGISTDSGATTFSDVSNTTGNSTQVFASGTALNPGTYVSITVNLSSSTNYYGKATPTGANARMQGTVRAVRIA
jgi:hypothetical protein